MAAGTLTLSCADRASPLWSGTLGSGRQSVLSVFEKLGAGVSLSGLREFGWAEPGVVARNLLRVRSLTRAAPRSTPPGQHCAASGPESSLSASHPAWNRRLSGTCTS